MKAPILLHGDRCRSARQTPHSYRARPGFCARARSRACCCAGCHDVVNQRDVVAGDRRVGDESISCIGEPAFFSVDAGQSGSDDFFNQDLTMAGWAYRD